MPTRPEKVYFFGTCLIDLCFPQAGMAGMELLQREGIQVVYPQSNPAAVNPPTTPVSRTKPARSPASSSKPSPRIIRSSFRPVPAAGCCKHHYPKLFADQPEAAEAQRFASRVFELNEFLVTVLDLKLEDRGQPIKVTWHSSCSALREMKVIDHAKSLLRQLKNVELIELQRERECCGFGGSFSVKQADISSAMVADKVADIEQTGAAVVLSGDYGCLMHIGGALKHRNSPIPAKHVAEFLLERTQ
jgi:L-lactate dehydrogenase complex protein LldE